MLRKALLFSLLAVFSGLGFLIDSVAAERQTVTDVRVAKQGEQYRVVIETTGRASHSIFTLANPDRLVVDLSNTRWAIENVQDIERSLLVSRVRHGVRKSGAIRIVFDLNAPVSILKKHSEGGGGASSRVIVELLPDMKTLEDRLPIASEPEPSPPEVAKELPVVRPSPKAKAAMPGAPVPRMKPKQSETVAHVAPIPVPVAPDARPPVSGRQKVPEMFQPGPTPVPAVKPSLRTGKIVVVIDPGHGGIDPGAISKRGQEEKELTLQYAIDLKRALERTGHYEVVLTRMDDRFLRLRERIAIARKVHGDLFISLHADSNPDPSARGLSVYTLSEKASDREAAMLANQENKSEILDGIDLSGQSDDVAGILIDLAQRESKNKSSRMATMMVRELKPHISLVRNTHRFAGFAVLKLPDMPSVLVELGFMSNEEDERQLKDKAYGRQIIEKLVVAVNKYYGHE